MALVLLGAAVFYLILRNREKLLKLISPEPCPRTVHNHHIHLNSYRVHNVHNHYHFYVPQRKDPQPLYIKQVVRQHRQQPQEQGQKQEQEEEEEQEEQPAPKPKAAQASIRKSVPWEDDLCQSLSRERTLVGGTQPRKAKKSTSKPPRKPRTKAKSPSPDIVSPALATTTTKHRPWCRYYCTTTTTSNSKDMPFVANTPESRIQRSDSRNPNTTCHGITSNGRPCRRPVSPVGREKTLDPGEETSYCWQHKEQAIRGTHSNPGPMRPLAEGDERSSLDTLADRMGLASLDDGDRRRKRRKDEEKTTIRTQIRCCFCFVIDTEDLLPPAEPVAARPQPRPLQNRTSVGLPGHLSPKPHSSPAAPGKNGRSRAALNHLRYILPTTDARTASALMKELARPYVDSEEAGYIYMFWMTPESKSSPPIDAARSLLAPRPSPGRRDRRPSDVVSSYAADAPSWRADCRSTPKKMLLKIGRAANVQKRMNQWSRQCGYDIEVLRFYPYIPSASDASGSGADAVPRMTPHCHRVERLIHLELAGLGLKADTKECKTCGKEHREWFEAEANRAGVRMVDEVIRRWIDWDEAQV